MLTRILSTIAMWCGVSALLMQFGAPASWSLIMSTITTAWTYWILDHILESSKDSEQNSNHSRDL